MNNMAQVQKLNERELELGISAEASWHAKYKDSAWVYVGGLSTDLSEGDIICVLSQWGEIEDFNYPRDKKTGKPRGWCWAKYEDQRSTILAVDNGNGASLLSRTLRVDHCEKYKLPPELRDRDDAQEAEAAGHYGPADAPKSKFAPGAVYELHVTEDAEAGVGIEGLVSHKGPLKLGAAAEAAGAGASGNRQTDLLTQELKAMSSEQLKEAGDEYQRLKEARDVEDVLFSGGG